MKLNGLKLIQTVGYIVGSLSILLCLILWLVFPKITNHPNITVKPLLSNYTIRVQYDSLGKEWTESSPYPDKDFITEEILSANADENMGNYHISIFCDMEVINNQQLPLPLKEVVVNSLHQNSFNYRIIDAGSSICENIKIEFEMTPDIFNYVKEHYEKEFETFIYYGDPTRVPETMADYLYRRMALIEKLVKEYYINNNPTFDFEFETQYNDRKILAETLEIKHEKGENDE